MAQIFGVLLCFGCPPAHQLLMFMRLVAGPAKFFEETPIIAQELGGFLGGLVCLSVPTWSCEAIHAHVCLLHHDSGHCPEFLYHLEFPCCSISGMLEHKVFPALQLLLHEVHAVLYVFDGGFPLDLESFSPLFSVHM